MRLKQNFISVDKQTAINSYGGHFWVGEIVGHEGAEDIATILSFEPDEDKNEVKVYTNKGIAHIDFLVKLENK